MDRLTQKFVDQMTVPRESGECGACRGPVDKGRVLCLKCLSRLGKELSNGYLK